MQGFIFRLLLILGIAFVCVCTYFVITEGPKAVFKGLLEVIGEAVLKVVAVIVIGILAILVLILLYHLAKWLFTGTF